MTADGIPQLEHVLQRFPGLRVVLDHLARPVQDGRPSLRGGRQSLAARQVSRRLRQGHGTQLRGRDDGTEPRRKRSSDGSCPSSARHGLRGARTFPPRSARCPSFSRWRRTRFASCRRRTANGSSRARRRRCIQRSRITNDAARGFTRHAALAARQPRRDRGAEDRPRVARRWSRSSTPTSRWSTRSSRR